MEKFIIIFLFFLTSPAFAGENNCVLGERLKDGERANQTFNHGVPPVSIDHCPSSHPVKGNINPSRKTCIYHQEGDRWFEKTDPERCYKDGKEAEKDGFRASKV